MFGTVFASCDENDGIISIWNECNNPYDKSKTIWKEKSKITDFTTKESGKIVNISFAAYEDKLVLAVCTSNGTVTLLSPKNLLDIEHWYTHIISSIGTS